MRALVAAVICLFAFGSVSAHAAASSEVVRGWNVTQVTPLVFVFEKPEKKQTAIFSVSPADITLEESNQYVRSSSFAKDAKRIREKDLAEALDTDVRVAGDRRNFEGTSVGIIETRFMAEGRSILMTEYVWVKNRLVFHFVVTTKNVVEPPSERSTEVFDEFTIDFALEKRKTASLFDLFFPRAEARGESVTPSRGGFGSSGGGGATRAGGASRQNCEDRTFNPPRDKNTLRPGLPALHLSASMRSCGAGMSRAWGEMKTSMHGALTEIANEADLYAKQYRCEQMNPNSPQRVRERNAARARARSSTWNRFTNFLTESLSDSGAAEAYSNCLSAAGTRAAVMYVARPVSQAAVALARAGIENVRRDPMRAAMNALIATNPALMMTKAAVWAGTGDNLEQAYNFVATQITGFTCLTNELQTEAFCSFVTHAAPELIIAAATGGYGAAVRGARIATALGKGLNAARSTLAASSRRVIARASAAAAERRAAAGAVTTAERRVVAAGAARTESAAAGAAGRRAAASEVAPAGRAASVDAESAVARAETPSAPAPTNVASAISSAPTEVLASSDEMASLATAMSQQRVAVDSVSTLSSTVPGQQLTVSVTRAGRTELRTVTREDAIRLSQDPSVDSLSVNSVKPMGTTPRLTAAQARKISPDTTTNLAASRPDAVVSVMVKFKSGEVGLFHGNPQMIRGMAARADVVGIEMGGNAPSWIAPTFRVNTAGRTAVNPLDAMRTEITSGSVVRSGRELGYENQVVFHGTVRENVASVRNGPQNVGAGFGGRGLYVALKEDRQLAETYSGMASQAAENRVANVAANVDPTTIDRTAVIMRGRLNPDKDYRVGVFEVGRNYFEPDLRRGRLPANWDDDPRLRSLMESEFDVIEIRNARANGMNISSDRYLVVHERAGADAVQWQRTDLTNRPPRASAAASAPLPVNTENVKMAANSWRENQSPSRNFLPRLNVTERQQYAARVLSTESLSARQATAFQRSAQEFRPEYWNDPAKMTTYRQSTTESLRRSGFNDEQINTLFESGAITGARPRP